MTKKIDLNKFKEVVGQLKSKQAQLQGLVSKETLKEAKRYAETSGNELKRLIRETDVKKVKSLIAKEASEIQKLQKAIPGELAKFSKFVEGQRKELEKILKTVNALEARDFIQKKVVEKVGIVKKKKPARKAQAAKAASSVEAVPVAAAPTVSDSAEA